MGVQVSAEFLKKISMTQSEFLTELAIHFYSIGKMTFGQDRHFVSLGVIDFQKEMQKRDVHLNYDEAALDEDL